MLVGTKTTTLLRASNYSPSIDDASGMAATIESHSVDMLFRDRGLRSAEWLAYHKARQVV